MPQGYNPVTWDEPYSPAKKKKKKRLRVVEPQSSSGSGVHVHPFRGPRMTQLSSTSDLSTSLTSSLLWKKSTGSKAMPIQRPHPPPPLAPDSPPSGSLSARPIPLCTGSPTSFCLRAGSASGCLISASVAPTTLVHLHRLQGSGGNERGTGLG